MATNGKGVHVATPTPGDHVQHIHSTPEDRAQHAKEFREEKKYQQAIKEERFEKIRQKRQAGTSGGKGINIEVTSDS